MQKHYNIVILTNTFRLDSRLIQTINSTNRETIFVNFSQWHYDNNYKLVYGANSDSYELFKQSISHMNSLLDNTLITFTLLCSTRRW